MVESFALDVFFTNKLWFQSLERSLSLIRRILIAVLLFSLMLFVACGKSDDMEQDESIKDDQVSEPAGEETPKNDTADQVDKDSETSADDTESKTDSATSPNENEPKDETNNGTVENENSDPETEIVMTGSFNGQADPHTIEVETDEGPTAYQLTMEARDMVVDLNPGDKVTFTYYKDGEMLVIKYIEVVEQ